MSQSSASPVLSFSAPTQSPQDRPHAHLWGFADSTFETEGGAIVLRSSRYENGGKPLDRFAPFVEQAVGIAFDPTDRHDPVTPFVPDPLPCDELVVMLAEVVGRDHCTQDAQVRLRHGHGHHLEEIFKVMYDKLDRVPDVVVYPETAEQVQGVLRVAASYHALVVPFGGGTAVTMALSCEGETRAIVALDLARMNRILWLDPESRVACIQAGAVGRSLEAQLRAAGYTLGHEPDSIEFSTLGGWVATNASGMKKNRYGNIEDIVLDVTVVTLDGVLSQACCVPRASHGIDVRKLIFGSEGLLGVVVQATVRVHRAPEVQFYGSLVFPTWQSGLSFMRQLSTWQSVPASVRLVDNLQFQFGRALKPGSGSSIGARLQKLFVEKVKGIDVTQMVACTIVYEGYRSEQEALRSQVGALAKQYGGFSAGGRAGKDGYNLTFGIAYIRDFLLQYWTLGDSFETSVPWGRVNELIAGVKAAVVRSHAEQGLAGRPFVTARISQVYPTGCCVYFYIGFHYKAAQNPLDAFKAIEHEARLAIIENGGALSHHHGIGKLRAPYLARVNSATALDWVNKISWAVDPERVFSSGNQGVPRGRSDR